MPRVGHITIIESNKTPLELELHDNIMWTPYHNIIHYNSCVNTKIRTLRLTPQCHIMYSIPPVLAAKQISWSLHLVAWSRKCIWGWPLPERWLLFQEGPWLEHCDQKPDRVWNCQFWDYIYSWSNQQVQCSPRNPTRSCKWIPIWSGGHWWCWWCAKWERETFDPTSSAWSSTASRKIDPDP